MIRVLYVGSKLQSGCSLTAQLPKNLLEIGVNVDVVVPHIPGTCEGASRLAKRLTQCGANIDGQWTPATILEGRSEDRVRTFYVDHTDLNAPLSLANDDAIKRCAIFCNAVCDWVKNSPIPYDVIHCEGLETALIPTLLHFSCDNCKAKTLVFVPGIEDKGNVDISWIRRLGLPDNMASSEGMEFYGKMSILKGAYLHADAICFANPSIRQHIEKNQGKNIGMEGVLFDKLDKLHTIHLGLDLKRVNPESDADIEANFSASDISGKQKCKAALTKKFRLGKDRPVVSFIGELSPESGIDLVNDILDDLMDQHVNLVIAGNSANEAYTHAVESWKQEFKGSVAWIENANCRTLRRLLSASDILLIPAKHECACMLHAIAMRYGCVVVARKQGAVAADIIPVCDIDNVQPSDNGFLFSQYDADQFYDATMDALDSISSKSWLSLQNNAMTKIVSVHETAKDCVKIYDALNH